MPADREIDVDRLEGAPYHYWPDDVVPEDVVVALEHTGLVTQLLDEADLDYRPPVQSELLGLSKITLQNPGDAGDKLRQQLADDDRLRRYNPDAQSGVDLVIAVLRASIGRENGGWFPPMGKNRLVSRVRPARVIWSGDGGSDPHRVIWSGDERPNRVIWSGSQNPQRVIWSAGNSGGNDKGPDAATGAPAVRPAEPGSGVVVGVLDSGVYPHPLLAGAWLAPFGDIVQDPDPHYLDGHGTFVTGLVLSQAPGATVYAPKALLGSEGTSDTWEVANDIVAIGQRGIDILNLSFGCYTDDGQPPFVLATAIDRLDPRIVVVAAAGNHALVPPEQEHDERAQKVASLPSWPAALDDVIAVGAVDRDGVRAPFSPAKSWVDISAVGVDVRSTYLPEWDGWAEWSGTSFAAPLVTGRIAAVMAEQELTPKEAAAAVLDSASQGAGDPMFPEFRPRYLTLDLW